MGHDFLIYVCIRIYTKKEKQKIASRMDRATGMAASQCPVPGTSVEGVHLSQVLQDDARHIQDHLRHIWELGNLSDS
jgi:hypothetical protein